MNDEFLRRQAADVGSDELPDYGFGGGPLFRDEVAPGAPGLRDGGGSGLDYGSGGDYGTGPASSGFGGPSGSPAPRFVDGRRAAGLVPPTRPPAAPAGPAGPDGQPQWGPNEGPLRVVPAAQASALLRIKLPDAPPVPATTLRSDAPIEAVVEAAQILHHVSPARPNALPGDVLALTMATMVVPMPGAAPGARPARLTASVPPDLASRAEADLLSDTVEQFFGDFDAIGRELKAQRAGGVAEAGARAGAGGRAATGTGSGIGAGASGRVGSAAGAGPGIGAGAEASQPPAVPGQHAPAAPAAGRYGVPTQFPGYDAARRSPVGMRYLGGIFHDSSGESSFYDPATESLVPMSAAAFSAADFRRASAPRALRPVPPPRTGTGSGAARATRPRDDDTAVMPPGHWTDHHPGHHRTVRGPGRRRGRLMLVSAVATMLAFGGAYAAAVALEGQVPQGTFVDGVGIGGLSRSAAEVKLAAVLAPRLSAPLLLTAGGTIFQLPPEESGLHIDYESTVTAAASDRDDPMVAVPALFGQGRDVPLRVRVDHDLLRAAVAKATAAFNKPVVDGGVTFPGGVPTPIAPRPGRQVDLDAAVNAVAAAFDGGVQAVRPTALGRGGGSGTGTALAIAPVAYAIGAKTAPAASHDVADPKQSPAMPSATPGPTPAPTPSAPAPAPVATPPSVTFPAPPITLLVHDVEPTVTPAAVAQAMQDFARPAMSAPITLVTGNIRTVLKPAVLGRHLVIAPDGHGALVPKLDAAGVRGEIDHGALARLEQPPTDAAFIVAGGKPVLVPGKNGTGYAPAAIQNSVLSALTKTAAAQRVVTVPLGPLPPALTTEAAQALGIKDVMGTYTTPFPAGAARTANVKRAADLLRGRILQPGEIFSLNQALGARSAANGFVPAERAPSQTAQDAGAGISLVATALFNAEYLAGLDDVEHHPHATVTDHFPPGMEAAVSYPDVDLKFKNDSGGPLYLWTASTDNAVTVAVLGQKAYDTVQTEMSSHYAQVPPKTTTASAGAACAPSDGVPGFQIDVTRILTKADQAPVRQVFHTSYAAQDKVVCGGAGPTGSAAAGRSPANSPTGGATASQHTTTGGLGGPGGGGSGVPGATSAPTSGGTPTGGATSGSPTTTPSAGWDGSLLGGLLGAPSSRR